MLNPELKREARPDKPILEISKRGILVVMVIGDSESLLGLKFTLVIFNIGNNSSKEFKPAASKASIRIIALTLFEFKIGSSDTSKLSKSI